MAKRTDAHAPAVYVARAERTGLLKVGTTANLDRRLAELSRLTKGAVTLVARLPGDAQLERHLHALCAADLVAGEWFRPGAAVLALVEKAKGAVRALDAARGGQGGGGDGASAAFAPAAFPRWLAIELRPAPLSACPCVRRTNGRAYALARCGACNGAGVVESLSATAEAA